jgi:hypothetical protein
MKTVALEQGWRPAMYDIKVREALIEDFMREMPLKRRALVFSFIFRVFRAYCRRKVISIARCP